MNALCIKRTLIVSSSAIVLAVVLAVVLVVVLAAVSTVVQAVVLAVVLAIVVAVVVKAVAVVSAYQYGSSGILPKKAKLKNIRPPSFILSPSFSGCVMHMMNTVSSRLQHNALCKLAHGVGCCCK
jgi:hypothetical protein